MPPALGKGAKRRPRPLREEARRRQEESFRELLYDAVGGKPVGRVLSRESNQHVLDLILGLATTAQQREQLLLFVDEVKRHVVSEMIDYFRGDATIQLRRAGEPVEQMAEQSLPKVIGKDIVERRTQELDGHRFE
jgi:hypothetical protein